MEKTKWSEYENYLVMAQETPNLKMNYGAFLDFKLIFKQFIKNIGSIHR